MDLSKKYVAYLNRYVSHVFTSLVGILHVIILTPVFIALIFSIYLILVGAKTPKEIINAVPFMGNIELGFGVMLVSVIILIVYSLIMGMISTIISSHEIVKTLEAKVGSLHIELDKLKESLVNED
jgi:hypothetical protein